MKSHAFKKVNKTPVVDVGSVIIAQPFWRDERYRRSVIIVLNHDSAGSTGIILNKQTTLSVSEAIPVITKNLPLYYGGPFDMHTVSFMHNNPNVPEAISMGNDLFWGGDFEHLEEMISDGKMDMSKIKFFAGFVEWIEGELESEISENKWWTSDLASNELFAIQAEKFWSHKLLMNGNMYGMMQTQPDPSFN